MQQKLSNQNGGEQAIRDSSIWLSTCRTSNSAIEALRQDGIEPDRVIDFGHVIAGSRLVFFRDPEGNIIELMEGYRDEVWIGAVGRSIRA